MKDFTKDSFSIAFKFFSVVMTISTFLFGFVPIGDFLKKTNFGGLSIPLKIIIVAIILALFYFLVFGFVCLRYFKTKVTVIKFGKNCKAYVQFDDIFNPQKLEKSDLKKDRIVVIPSNRCFDTEVGKIMIGEESIQGQAINKIIKNDAKLKLKAKDDAEKELHSNMVEFLNGNGFDSFKQLSAAEKPSGYLERYKAGAIAEICLDKERFWFLGLTRKDKDFHGTARNFELAMALLKLFNFSVKHGKKDPILLPVIGAKTDDVDIKECEIVKFILSVIKLFKDRIKFNIYIMILKDKSEINSVADFK